MYTIAAAVVYLYSAAAAQASVWFLPDWQGAGVEHEIDMDINVDTKWCEKEGFTYYSSGSCPAYNNQQTCERSKKYLKCDPSGWCKDNGYNTTSCSIPKYLDTKCPNGLDRYKGCKEDTARACKDLGYKNTCSSGQKLHASSGRCSYNNSYGTCCSPSACPANTSLSGSYGSSGSSDGCGYECKYTCNMNCPSGTSTSNPGGCGGSTTNGCGNRTCYYPYQSCCNSSSSNWCSVHGTCHGNCCTDGTISSCDPQCGGSGCGGGGGGGSSCNIPANYHNFCCDDVGSYCGGLSDCVSRFWMDPLCSDLIAECRACGRTPSWEGCGNWGYDTKMYCN